jgi:uncharacterized protein (TIGR03067 family)
MNKLLLLAPAVLALAAADKPDDATKKDMDTIQGTWKSTSAQFNGKDLPAEEGARASTVFDGDKFKHLNGGSVVGEGTFKLDANKKPAAIDMTDKDGKTRMGIYQFDGDTLKVAMSDPGKDRPTELASKADSGVFFITLKRDKK